MIPSAIFIQACLRNLRRAIHLRHGVGMSPEVRGSHLRTFFYDERARQGFGMGCHGLRNLRQHGGFIHVYSEPGQGSLFHVYLPVMEVSIAESHAGIVNVAKIEKSAGLETILLAEDHDSIRE